MRDDAGHNGPVQSPQSDLYLGQIRVTVPRLTSRLTVATLRPKWRAISQREQSVLSDLELLIMTRRGTLTLGHEDTSFLIRR